MQREIASACNLIIYIELLVPGPDVAALDELLDVYDTLRTPLPWACASLAAKAFALSCRRGGSRQLPIPDFYIGAQAAVSNLSVLTRDPAGYRSYFPRLAVLASSADLSDRVRRSRRKEGNPARCRRDR